MSSRFTLEVSDEERAIFDHYVPHGFKKLIFGKMVRDACYMIQKYKGAYIAAVVNDAVNFRGEPLGLEEGIIENGETRGLADGEVSGSTSGLPNEPNPGDSGAPQICRGASAEEEEIPNYGICKEGCN